MLHDLRCYDLRSREPSCWCVSSCLRAQAQPLSCPRCGQKANAPDMGLPHQACHRHPCAFDLNWMTRYPRPSGRPSISSMSGCARTSA